MSLGRKVVQKNGLRGGGGNRVDSVLFFKMDFPSKFLNILNRPRYLSPSKLMGEYNGMHFKVLGVILKHLKCSFPGVFYKNAVKLV